MTNKRTAWREPMVWMLIGLPLASVFIGFALLFAAVRPGREDMDTASHQAKVGKLLVSAQSAEAASLNLVLRSKGDMIEALPTDGEFPRGGKLTLTLTSADPSHEGRTYRLVPSELGWRGVGSLQAQHDWIVQLSPDDAAWHLRGRWATDSQSIRLMP